MCCACYFMNKFVIVYCTGKRSCLNRQRAHSLPRMYKGDLLDELGMEENWGRKSTVSVTGLEEDILETSRTCKSRVRI